MGLKVKVNMREQLLMILFSCKKWIYLKLSQYYVDSVENIIILITVALWKICCRTFAFLQTTGVEGFLSYHGNIYICNELSTFLNTVEHVLHI